MPVRVSYLELAEKVGQTAGEASEKAEGLFEFKLNEFSFYCSAKKDYEMWTGALAKITIQGDFHAKFHPIKVLGEGSTARVHLVEDKSTKEKFAVKGFSKEFLNKRENGKVSLLYSEQPRGSRLVDVRE